jgi:leader peptidase (prepilin peptidase)/N-methyltransferase
MTLFLSVCVTLSTILGALIGSFLNVVIYRVPRGQSVVSPPSSCPSCGHAIRGIDNIPILSWLFLQGMCRDCSEPISRRYPLVELATALSFAGVSWWTVTHFSPVGAPSGPSMTAFVLTLIAFLYLTSVSIALAVIDLDTHRLPNKIVLPCYAVGTVFLGAAALLSGEHERVLGASIGLAALWLAYFLMAVLYPGGMGFGDVKLAGVLGLVLGWLGWGPLIVGSFSAFLLGGVFALVLLASRRATRKGGIPFGPWMLVGAWLGIFAGDSLWFAYLALFGLA